MRKANSNISNSLRYIFTLNIIIILICVSHTVQAANFQGPEDFYGVYEGSWDGRRARLTIDDRVGDFPVFICNITLEDLDRNTTYRASSVKHAEHKHMFRDVKLKGIRGTNGSKFVKIILLHTWNTDYLSGMDIWNNREFGFSFKRVR